MVSHPEVVVYYFSEWEEGANLILVFYDIVEAKQIKIWILDVSVMNVGKLLFPGGNRLFVLSLEFEVVVIVTFSSIGKCIAAAV
jgi:hypothetical protein